MAYTTTTTTASRNWHSPFSMASNALAWVFALIVLGITAWFTHLAKGDAGRHVMYQLVVAVLTVVLWPVVLFTSRRDGFGTAGRLLMPLVLAFSYLWLASTVVSIDDWAADACEWSWPLNRCAYKHSVIAFNFLTFFFIYAALVVGSWLTPRGTAHHGTHV